MCSLSKDKPYYLGCPVWASDRWAGSLFPRGAPRSDWLTFYSQVFSTVEGNSTFYALPSRELVERWIDQTEPGFRFALKFPRVISHEKRLLNTDRETSEFVERLQMLFGGGRLGPCFLQLPQGFSDHHLNDLESYLDKLPRDLPLAVEVRHRVFFEGGPAERELNSMLSGMHVDRVVFDSRPLYSAPPSDNAERESQSRKPNLPVHHTRTGDRPFVRFVGRNDIGSCLPWIHEWVPIVASWIEAGVHPYFFTHTPDDRFAPHLARLFHQELEKHTQHVKPMPPWPGESEQHERQMTLFD